MCGFLFILIKWTVLLYGLGAILRFFLKKFYYGTLDTKNEENITDKIVIITGANSGTGKAAALGFAKRGAKVIMACRSESNAKEAENWIRTKTWRGELIFIKLDLSSLASVREFVKEFNSKFDKLDILVNNAGLVGNAEDKMKTKDGFEIHMGVHHVAHFLLTNLLLESLKKAKSSRVVTVSSFVHSRTTLDVDDLFSEKKPVPKVQWPMVHHYYSRSKLANALFNKELAKRLEGTGVTCYAICPGPVNSSIMKRGEDSGPMKLLLGLLFSIPASFAKTIEEGADTILYCALNKDLAKESGDMYQNCGHWDAGAKLSDEDARKLWEVTAKLVEL